MNMFLELFLVVLVMTISNAIGTLKTIFTAKKYFRPVYVIVFIDAIIFATVITKVTSDGEYLYILAFAVGKMLGVLVGGAVEEKIAIGMIEADITVSDKDRMITISDQLRKAGFSVNTMVTYGINGNKRYVIEITAKRKDIGHIKKVLDSVDCNNPTMTIKEVSNVFGKVCSSSN
ncbi:MAG: hypothetical protein APF76_10695 [Desulfitibacter sp. BRH_c19]|nr:MAG: hypothetical protein APF76_10695 [Desulfitibacter sp. BRH_c19]